MVQENQHRRSQNYKRIIATGCALVLCCVLHARAWFHIGSERYNVIKSARAEVGVREVGCNNCGERIAEYLKAVGLKEGYPYCSAGIAWNFNQNAIPHTITAWSPTATPMRNRIWQRGGRNNQTPLPGDVFSLYYPNLGRIGHAGLVLEWGEKWVITIEWNTGPDGGRDGDGVHIKKRLISTIYAVSRWIN